MAADTAKGVAADPASGVCEFAKVGEYQVMVGKQAVAFWPLVPGVAALASVMPPLVCAPNLPTTMNTTTIPVFGIFDVLIRMSDDVVSEDIQPSALPRIVVGLATQKKMPLVCGTSRDVRICFAVDHSKVAAGGTWTGTLRLTAPYRAKGAKKTCTLEVPLTQARLSAANDLFVWFVVHGKPPKTYAWTTLKAVEAADGTTPVAKASVDLKVLRDNQGSGFSGINRRVSLLTGTDGSLEPEDRRRTLALPINWPLVFTVTKNDYVTRAHMIRLGADDAKKDNLTPTVLAPIRMTKLAAARLTGKTILLDAGHGVVYGLAKARRTQEWYVAHRVLERLSEILMQDHGMKDSDFLWTRTAGFGLIDPGQVHAAGAPENGDARYVVDLPNWRLRARIPAVQMHHISALLRTKHADPDDHALPLGEADRNRFLADNQAAVARIVARTNHALPHGQRVRPGSERWDPGSNRYVFTHESVAANGQVQVIHNAAPLTITTGDWFALDEAGLTVLADRSARWAIACEIGSGPKADGARPSFTAAARATLKSLGATAYMRDEILAYLDVQAPHPFLDHGIKGWSPDPRNTYFSQHAADCDLAISMHENASGGKGGMLLVSHLSGQDAPPADQIRLAKVFVKYLDWFDQGVRGEGIVRELAANPAAMLHHGNHIRDRHAYIEAEFMDAILPNDPTKYRYQQMTDAAAIDHFARQIVAAIVESLLDRQSDLEAVRFNPKAPLGGLW